MALKNYTCFVLLCVFIKVNWSSSDCKATAVFNNNYPAENITLHSLRKLVKDIVPELLNSKTKGEAGKIAVIGGSVEYTEDHILQQCQH